MTQQTTLIQVKKRRTDQEPRIHDIMTSKMSDYSRYFAPVEKVQVISLRSLTKNDLRKCAECGNDKKEYVRITRRETGRQTLEERILEHEKKQPSSTKEKVEDYYEHVVEGLSKLKDAHIVHFNIQSKNIIYSDSEYCPIIMDFSEAFVIEDLYKDESLRSVFVKPHPLDRCLEARCIAQIIEEPEWKTKKANVSQLEEIITEFFKDGSDEVEGERWKHYIRKIGGKKQGKVIVNELLQNWHTWDLYSVNRIFCRLMKLDRLMSYRTSIPGEPYEKLKPL